MMGGRWDTIQITRFGNMTKIIAILVIESSFQTLIKYGQILYKTIDCIIYISIYDLHALQG